MSERGEPHQRRIREVLEEVRRLREQGAGARAGLGEPDEPPGGWQPILDDDGNVIPDPPPSEPTDVPADYAADGGQEGDEL